MRKNLILVIVFAVLFAGNACTYRGDDGRQATNPVVDQTSGRDPAQTIVPQNGCIPPLATFAYSTSVEYDQPIPRLNFDVLPPPPWQVVADIPDMSRPASPYVMQTRPVNGGTELWVNRGLGILHLSYDIDMKPDDFYFLVYRSDTKEWKRVPQVIENSEVSVIELFVTRNGEIWGHNDLEFDKENPNLSILSKYNEQLQRFEFAVELESLTEKLKDDPSMGRSRIIFLDQNDVFWIVASGHGIYSYGIESQVIEKHLDLSDVNIQQAALAPDGSIFYIREQRYPMNNALETQLYHFFPATGELEHPPVYLYDSQTSSTILVDHRNRLWFSALGWMEPDGGWHQIFPSPIFLTNYREVGTSPLWRLPQIVLESSNGWFWYHSDNGMAYLNFEEQEWCWFTTEQGWIIEDHDRRLWMIVDDRLYSYSIDP